MKEYRIAVLEGDGIGPEIVSEAVKVLDRTAQTAVHQHQTTALNIFDCLCFSYNRIPVQICILLDLCLILNS